MQLLVRDLEINGVINNQWIMDNCYIAGGACVSNATRMPIHDVDIYFKTKDARDIFVKEVGEEKYITKSSNVWKALMMYESLLKNEIIELGEGKSFMSDPSYLISSKMHENTMFYTITNYYDDYVDDKACVTQPLFDKQKWMFANGYDHVLIDRNHFDVEYKDFFGNKSITLKRGEMIYQFILRFYGDPKQMMDDTFDFQHCKIAYDLATKEYIASQETWEALSKRELHYVNSFYPVSSLKRLYKYGGRGFKWNNDEYVKIVRDIHKVDTDNKFVMEDQLIGYYEDFDYNEVFGNED